MPVISVDLASGHYRDVGVVVAGRDTSGILVTPIDLEDAGLTGRPDAPRLARFLVELAKEIGATAIGLDGPQGWKLATNGELHSRVCEARLRTQGKTGVPGITKPANYLGFITFCVQTFDALHALGWYRFGASGFNPHAVAIETFPTAAWRAVGLAPLPGKSKARAEEVVEWTARLISIPEVTITAPLTHDQLQAAISGLGVLALSEGREKAFEAIGMAPFIEAGSWLEGFIVNPRN